jgi:hypothetical protein
MTAKKPPERRMRGFERTSSLLAERIRKAGEARGFAATRLLTHWAEIAGEEIALVARPVDVKYGREGFGATLTLLTTGAQAPMLEMQKEKLRERVNAVYGYAAISRIRITQIAAAGFSEGRAEFTTAPPPENAASTDPLVQTRARRAAATVADSNLREALEALGQNILSRQKAEKDLP